MQINGIVGRNMNPLTKDNGTPKMKQKSIRDFFKCFTDSLVFKKGRNVDSVPMEESLCLQLESSLEESPVFKRKNSQANSPSLDKVTSLTPHVIRVVRRL